MKNLLRSTLYLSVFALAGILFQISCSNSDNKNVTNNVTALQNKLIYTVFNYSTGQTIWTSNYDGTNPTQVPITLPTNISFNNVNGNADAKLSPDGQKIFFIVVNNSTGGNEIYSCDINGSNLQQVFSPSTSSNVKVNVN